MLTTVRTANRTVRNPHGSVRATNRTATPRFGSWGVRTATVRHGSPNRRGSWGKQTATVRDFIVKRFSDLHVSCAVFTSHISQPSPLFSHAVFHAPRIQTRPCPIHHRHSHSLLTSFAYTHAAVLASDRIFTAPPSPSQAGALLFSRKDTFSAFSPP